MQRMGSNAVRTILQTQLLYGISTPGDVLDAASPETSCVGLVMMQKWRGKGHVRIEGIVACPFFLAARRGGSIVVSGVGTTIMSFVTRNGTKFALTLCRVLTPERHGVC